MILIWLAQKQLSWYRTRHMFADKPNWESNEHDMHHQWEERDVHTLRWQHLDSEEPLLQAVQLTQLGAGMNKEAIGRDCLSWFLCVHNSFPLLATILLCRRNAIQGNVLFTVIGFPISLCIPAHPVHLTGFSWGIIGNWEIILFEAPSF